MNDYKLPLECAKLLCTQQHEKAWEYVEANPKSFNPVQKKIIESLKLVQARGRWKPGNDYHTITYNAILGAFPELEKDNEYKDCLKDQPIVTGKQD